MRRGFRGNSTWKMTDLLGTSWTRNPTVQPLGSIDAQASFTIVHDMISPYAIYGVLGLQLTAIALICWWRSKRYNRGFKWGTTSRLYLKVLTQADCQMLYLDTLMGNPNDFTAVAPEYLSDLHVRGLWAPRVTFSWEGLHITNTLNGRRHVLKNAFHVSWRTAWILRRRVLVTDYIATLVLYSQHFTALNLNVEMHECQ